MKIVFDSGVIISFSETCFIPLFKDLKENLGNFIITKNVKFECIDKVRNVMRFKLSSTRIEEEISSHIFDVYQSDKALDETTNKIMYLTNNMFYVRGNPIKIIQIGEAESLALLGLTDASYLAVDERTTRMIIEQPHALLEIFKRKYKTSKVSIDEQKYIKFMEIIGNVNVIRSVDFLVYAYRKGLLASVFKDKNNLKGALYALKFKGCSVSFEEINEYIDNL
ncbi:hypothetical protein GW835_01180 [archaeon]|jgi:predicted nucleic acid-binding protein|nr:hypothetical protein [archaeon]NCP79165.1 hypothetical protein [archaeon]NCP97888.1 hypothetical protein [archaeon]NCQ06932.1 hypothetical protein [archaeon]NCQ50728.1 hypothetical protein [archaeon]